MFGAKNEKIKQTKAQKLLADGWYLVATRKKGK